MANLAHWMLGLLIASMASAVPEYTMPRRDFKIPILAEADQKAHIEKYLLYVSMDGGLTWKLADMAGADQTHFVYFAPNDGSYWFAVQVTGKDGTRIPNDIAKLEAAIKVVVATNAAIRESAKPTSQETELAELRARVKELEHRLELAELRTRINQLEERLRKLEGRKRLRRQRVAYWQSGPGLSRR